MSVASAVHSANLRLAKSEPAFFNAICPLFFLQCRGSEKSHNKHLTFCSSFVLFISLTPSKTQSKQQKVSVSKLF